MVSSDRMFPRREMSSNSNEGDRAKVLEWGLREIQSMQNNGQKKFRQYPVWASGCLIWAIQTSFGGCTKFDEIVFRPVANIM